MHPALAADLFEALEFAQRVGVVIDAQLDLIDSFALPLPITVICEPGRVMAADPSGIV